MKDLSANITTIRELRRLAGLTQGKAARAARIPRSKLSLMETGEITLSAPEEMRLRRALFAEIRSRAQRIAGILSDTQAELAHLEA